eukprot:1140132-Pelagomonas_calceolata.AAC.3
MAALGKLCGHACLNAKFCAAPAADPALRKCWKNCKSCGKQRRVRLLQWNPLSSRHPDRALEERERSDTRSPPARLQKN